jgi:hypothetical protein
VATGCLPACLESQPCLTSRHASRGRHSAGGARGRRGRIPGPAVSAGGPHLPPPHAVSHVGLLAVLAEVVGAGQPRLGGLPGQELGGVGALGIGGVPPQHVGHLGHDHRLVGPDGLPLGGAGGEAVGAGQLVGAGVPPIQVVKVGVGGAEGHRAAALVGHLRRQPIVGAGLGQTPPAARAAWRRTNSSLKRRRRHGTAGPVLSRAAAALHRVLCLHRVNSRQMRGGALAGCKGAARGQRQEVDDGLSAGHDANTTSRGRLSAATR